MLNGRQLAAVTGVAVAGLMIAYMRGIPLAAGFSLGLGLLMILILKHGAEWSGVLASMKRGAGHTKEVVWILLLIGLLIPAWTASGTIPYMIHLGLGLLNPAYFLSFTFIFAAVISMTIGTSTGTLSAIGIPLLGMASFLQIPLPLVAGALASGAFVGDRSSPFSSAHQLVAASAGVSSAAQLKAMLPTTVAAVAASLLFYAAADWFGQWRTSAGEAVTTAISDRFVLHPALIVPPVLLIASVLLRLRIRTAFLLAIAAAIALGSLLQHLTPAAWLHALWSGYDNGESERLRGKGISDMFGLVLLIAMAGAFNGILEEYRILQPYMAKVLGPSVSLFRSTFRSCCSGSDWGLYPARKRCRS